MGFDVFMCKFDLHIRSLALNNLTNCGIWVLIATYYSRILNRLLKLSIGGLQHGWLGNFSNSTCFSRSTPHLPSFHIPLYPHPGVWEQRLSHLWRAVESNLENLTSMHRYELASVSPVPLPEIEPPRPFSRGWRLRQCVLLTLMDNSRVKNSIHWNLVWNLLQTLESCLSMSGSNCRMNLVVWEKIS